MFKQYIDDSYFTIIGFDKIAPAKDKVFTCITMINNPNFKRLTKHCNINTCKNAQGYSYEGEGGGGGLRHMPPQVPMPPPQKSWLFWNKMNKDKIILPCIPPPPKSKAPSTPPPPPTEYKICHWDSPLLLLLIKLVNWQYPLPTKQNLK